MDIDGYTAKRDEEFPYGEQYWVYHKDSLVGWVRYHCGILAATNVTDKEAKFPSPFLIHELYGPEPDNFFPSGTLRRAALRRCLEAIAKHYGTAKDPIKLIFSTMGPAESITLEQTNLFGDSNV